MKPIYLIITLSLAWSCVPTNEPTPIPAPCYFCDQVPIGGPSTEAVGEISQQNAGPKRNFQVEEAALFWLEDNVYALQYIFTTGDQLEIILAEATQDFNYHFPKPFSENQILEVFFNEAFLELKDAALSLQPRPEAGGFHTVVNIHTLDFGDWNGTVNRVPYIE